MPTNNSFARPNLSRRICSRRICSRRKAISRMALAACFLPVAGCVERPGTLPLLRETEQEAWAYGYVEDVARLDRQAHPEFMPGESCKTCALYRGGIDSTSGPCNHFRGYTVMSSGWCSEYDDEIT